MKIIWRGLLVAAFFGTGFNSMAFSVWSEIPAREFSRQEQVRMSKTDGAEPCQEAGNSNETIAAVEGPVVLSTGSARVALQPISTTAQRTLASRIQALAPGHRIYLVLKGLQVVKQPGTLYRLYLDLPSDAKPSRNDPHYIGTLNFFNAVKSSGFGAPTTQNSLFFSYDITATVKNLQARRLLSDSNTITIFASRTPNAESEPRIGRIELVEQ